MKNCRYLNLLIVTIVTLFSAAVFTSCSDTGLRALTDADIGGEFQPCTADGRCDDGLKCSPEQICVLDESGGACETVDDCPDGLSCLVVEFQSDSRDIYACVSSEDSCETDSDCPEGLGCQVVAYREINPDEGFEDIYGCAVSECNMDADCSAGYFCFEHNCTVKLKRNVLCNTDADCAEWYKCIHISANGEDLGGECAEVGGEGQLCDRDGRCKDGLVCNSNGLCTNADTPHIVINPYDILSGFRKRAKDEVKTRFQDHLSASASVFQKPTTYIGDPAADNAGRHIDWMNEHYNSPCPIDNFDIPGWAKDEIKRQVKEKVGKGDDTDYQPTIGDCGQLMSLDMSRCRRNSASSSYECLDDGTIDDRDKGIGDISWLNRFTGLQQLSLGSNQVSDIRALSSLTSLQQLSLVSNQISDISALSGLTSLQSLYLGFNQISNISELNSLTSLQTLDLWGNQISNISELNSLTSLQSLSLVFNQISNISALSGLTSLQHLYLRSNRISDISALSGLTNLQVLSLEFNQIDDISPLVENGGIGAGDEIYLRGNPLCTCGVYNDDVGSECNENNSDAVYPLNTLLSNTVILDITFSDLLLCQ